MSLAELLPWLKALHVAAAMTLVGGLLAISIVLPLATGGALSRPLAAAVLDWDRRVTVPALGLVWVLGVTLATAGAHWGERWLQAKLVLVVAVSGLHGVQSGRLRRLAGAGPTAGRPLGWLVVALACAIAVLAVVKPF